MFSQIRNYNRKYQIGIFFYYYYSKARLVLSHENLCEQALILTHYLVYMVTERAGAANAHNTTK